MKRDRSGAAAAFRKRLEEAFQAPDAPEVFHSVVHRHDLWKEDPFDVEAIHAEARQAFERLVLRAIDPPGTTGGRILLLLGESGSGKTHLLRAFRNSVHQRGLAFAGYLQMTSGTASYGRYLLRNLIESLDQPYSAAGGPTSGLSRLSAALCQSLPDRVRLGGDELPLGDALSQEGASPERVTDLVRRAAEAIVRLPSHQGIDIDLISAFLYLRTESPLLRNLVLKYLRGEDLSSTQRSQLGGMAPRVLDDDPLHLVEQLGRLMWAAARSVLVLFLDQLEDIYVLEDGRARFQRAMAAVRAVADGVPSSVTVISGLKDYYEELRGDLSRSLLDRIENDPEPIELKSARTRDEVRLILERRLRLLYQRVAGSADWPDGVPRFHPFTEEDLDRLAGLRTRDVIDWCRHLRSRWSQAEGAALKEPAPSGAAGVALEQAWNDFLADRSAAPPEGEAALTALLARALGRCGRELDGAPVLTVSARENHILVDGWQEPLVVGLCDRGAAGGALGRQVAALEEVAAGRRVVIARSLEYPHDPRTKIAALLEEVAARGGRRVVIPDSEWRSMEALERFEEEHRGAPGFEEWLRAERPLLRRSGLQGILGLSAPLPAPAADQAAPPLAAPPQPPRAPASEGEPITGGRIERPPPRTVAISLGDLSRHVAFVGGAGSGKTTAALSSIEQLLLLGIPAILIDRKGDLCGYADPERSGPMGGGAREAALSRLREAVQVDLYTPGDPRGRLLAVPLIPPGARPLPPAEREELVRWAAAAICALLGPGRHSAAREARAAVLESALSILSRREAGLGPTLDEVIEVIHSRDPDLLATGVLDPDLCRKLVSDLKALRLAKAHLLRQEGEVLDAAAMLGAGGRGRTRLTIIGTQFLVPHHDRELWMAQLFTSLVRWASEHPSSGLKAILLLGDAGDDLSVACEPAVKGPLEALLQRAPSAGLGILLVAEGPGDLDERCCAHIGTWLLGRLEDPTGAQRMTPLSGLNGAIGTRLASLEPGQFYLARDGTVKRVRTRPALLPPQAPPEKRILELAGNPSGVLAGRAAPVLSEGRPTPGPLPPAPAPPVPGPGGSAGRSRSSP
jgi:AAA ATPase-like protein